MANEKTRRSSKSADHVGRAE